MKRKMRFGWLFFAAAVVLALVLWREPAVGTPVDFDIVQDGDAETMVREYAEAAGVRYRDYPKSLVELLDRNPETKEFVLNYPFRKEETVDMREYDRSEGVPLLMQWDTRWGYMEYGSDVVGLTGCGPVCLAMAGYYVTGDPDFSPDRMVEFALDNGYCTPGSGSSWSLISEGGMKLGLDVTEIPLVKQRIMDNLEAGNPIICVMGPGDFTTSGHYIVLVGTEDGKLRVNDPNSREKSEKLWEFEQIEGQFRNLWVIREG